VRVVGRLRQDRWTGTDGKNYCKVKVVADHVEFKPKFKDKGPDSASNPDTDTALLAVQAAGETAMEVAEETADTVF